MPINKGDRAYLKHPAQSCKPPTPAVCYHHYEVGHHPQPVYCFLFPNGNSDSFTTSEAKHFFKWDKVRNFNKVALYSYENRQKLKEDYNDGYFDICFEEQTIVTDTIAVEQQRLQSLEERKGAEKIILVKSRGTKRYGLIVIWDGKHRTWELFDEKVSGNLYYCLTKITQ